MELIKNVVVVQFIKSCASQKKCIPSLSSVVDSLIGVHIALLLQDVQPLLHRVFVLDQRALILLKTRIVS